VADRARHIGQLEDLLLELSSLSVPGRGRRAMLARRNVGGGRSGTRVASSRRRSVATRQAAAIDACARLRARHGSVGSARARIADAAAIAHRTAVARGAAAGVGRVVVAVRLAVVVAVVVVLIGVVRLGRRLVVAQVVVVDRRLRADASGQSQRQDQRYRSPLTVRYHASPSDQNAELRSYWTWSSSVNHALPRA
jgi:hypothetical protein